MSANDFGFLSELQGVIAERKANPSDRSYTSSLFDAGRKRIAQKVGEEGVEVALAGICDDLQALTDESADLLFHLLVLLADHGTDLQTVVATLEARHLGQNHAGSQNP